MARNAAHEQVSHAEEVQPGSERSFGLVFAIVFAIIGIYPLFADGTPNTWAFVVAAVFMMAALAVPSILKPLNRIWFKFGMVLHHIVNPIIMGLLFFVAVTPTALIMRALGKDPLKRKREPEAQTYWIERSPAGPAPETMKNQF